jgi:transcriptional regulator prz1
MVRCASSPGKPSEFQASPAGQVMDTGNISDPNDKLDLERSKNEPQLKPELSSQMLDSSPSRSKVKVEPMDNALQTAAQTHTPVVTTTAAQAASASRRKAEALFTCPFPDCGSTFTRQYNLRGHMRSHMDERPFKCEWPGCGRSFARTHDCKRHHNLHLNIKPYQCESCGKTFARLDALNRHHKSEASTCGAKLHESKPV